MPQYRSLLVIAIALGLIVLGALAASVGQVPLPPTVPAGGPDGGPAISALLLVQEAGLTKYVAAGTGDGLRIYEVRRVGNKYRVTDVTAE